MIQERRQRNDALVLRRIGIGAPSLLGKNRYKDSSVILLQPEDRTLPLLFGSYCF